MPTIITQDSSGRIVTIEAIQANIAVTCPLAAEAAEKQRQQQLMNTLAGYAPITGTAQVQDPPNAPYDPPELRGQKRVSFLLNTITGRYDSSLYIWGLRLYATPISFFNLGTAIVMVGNKPVWTSPLWNTVSVEPVMFAARHSLHSVDGYITGGIDLRPSTSESVLISANNAASKDVYTYACYPVVVVAARQYLEVLVGGVDLDAPGCPDALHLCMLGAFIRDVA